MSLLKPLLHASALLLASTSVLAQPSESLQRLPSDTLDVRSPAERVTGAPGTMRITDRSCRSLTMFGAALWIPRHRSGPILASAWMSKHGLILRRSLQRGKCHDVHSAA